MITRLLILSVFALSAIIGLSQPYHEWSFGIGANGTDQPRSLTTDDSGNVYVVGIFSGTVDFDPGPGTLNLTALGFYDCFIQKLSASGDLVWVKSFGDAGGTAATFGLDVDVDLAGNVLVCGEFRNTVDFDPGSGVSDLTAVGSDDGFILKLDSNGDFVWVRQFGGSDEVITRTVACDSQGDIICGGEFRATVDFDPGAGVTSITSAGNRDFFVLKLSATGNLDWVNAAGNTDIDRVQKIAIDALDNVLITGGFQGTVDFNYGAGTANLNSSGSSDAFVQKLDPNGTHLWVRKLGGNSGGASGTTVDVDNSNNVIVGGGFSGTGNFGAGMLTSNGGTDMYLSSFSSTGNPVWTRGMGTSSSNDAVTDLSINDDNEVVFTGIFQNTVDFDPGAGVFNLTGGAFTENAFICKFDENGNFGWAEKISSTSGNERPHGISTFGIGVYIAGYFDGPVDLDPTAGTNSVNTAGDFDVFVLRLNECLVTTSTINPVACSSYTAPSGNNTWTMSGVYEDIIPSATGCDSVITINLTIEDVTAPVADASNLPDLTDQCEITSLNSPTATDNCTGSITGTHNASLPIIASTTVTWTYDDGNGNTSTQTQNVIINDNTAPVADASNLPDLTDQCEITSLNSPTATDNCTGSITGTHNASLPITASTTVTWTYDDGNGNTSTQTQNAVINDNTAPVADMANLSNVTAECEVTSLTPPTATDNCAGSITGTHNASLPISAQGTTTITWTYDDGNGNTTTQTQDIVIADATVPTADLANLSDINSECEVTPTAPTATDNCAGAITGTPDVSFPITASGTTTVTWTYDDGNGNTSTQTQDVIITPIDVSTTTTPNTNDYTISANTTGYTYQWIDCGNGNAAIAGSTAQGYTPIANGSYAVILDNGTCADTSDCVVIDDLNIEDVSIPQVNVWPNPTSGHVKVTVIGALPELESIKLYDMTGKAVEVVAEVVSDHSIALNLKNPSTGIYLLEIRFGEQSIRERLIVN